MFRQVLHPRKVWLHPKVQGYSLLWRNLRARWEEIQNPTQRRLLQRNCKMHSLVCWWSVTGKLVATKKIRRCGPFRIWNWECCRCDRETGCWKKQLRGTSMHPVNQTARDVQRLKGQNGHTISTRVSSHTLTYGSSILDRQGDLRRRTWRPYGWSGREDGYLGHILDTWNKKKSLV